MSKVEESKGGDLVTTAPVVVTGASGYIASHTVKLLLERGYRVRGTVRSTKNLAKYEYLTSLPGASERLELVEGNLNTPGSYDGAVAGCEYVIHMASPFALNVKNAQTELIDPAVNGTNSVLASCTKAGTVKRVVLTSSMAAIMGVPENKKTYTEADWNETCSVKKMPYFHSKALAEKAAWKYVEGQEGESKFDLVTINPYLVIGPSMTKTLGESGQVLASLLNGEFPMYFHLNMGFVDVRDVALAHFLAMTNPAASGRHVLCGPIMKLKEIGDILVDIGYGKKPFKLPKRTMWAGLSKVAAGFQPADTKAYLKGTIGKDFNFDNSKSRTELGLEYRDVRSTIRDHCADMEKWGHIKVLTK